MKKVSQASVAGLQAQLVEKRTVYERAKESYDAMRQDLALLASPYEVEDVLVYRRPKSGTKHTGVVELVRAPQYNKNVGLYELGVRLYTRSGGPGKMLEYITGEDVLEVCQEVDNGSH